MHQSVEKSDGHAVQSDYNSASLFKNNPHAIAAAMSPSSINNMVLNEQNMFFRGGHTTNASAMLESSHGSLAHASLGNAQAMNWPAGSHELKEAAGPRNLGNSGSNNPFRNLALNSGSMDAYSSEEGLPPIPSRQDRANRAARDSLVFVSQGSEDSAGEADELEATSGDEAGTKLRKNHRETEQARNYARRGTAVLQVNNIELDSDRQQDRQIETALRLA